MGLLGKIFSPDNPLKPFSGLLCQTLLFGIIRAKLPIDPSDYLALISRTSRMVIKTARNNAPPNKAINKDLDKCSLVPGGNIYLSATPITIIPMKTKNGIKSSQESEVNIISSTICNFHRFLNSVPKSKETII